MGAARAISGSVPAACCLCAALASAGCASPAPRTGTPASGPGVYAGNQGGAWEAVLPLARAPGASWADARRDTALSVAGEASVLDAGVWPEPDRPSLDQTRQLLIINRPEFVHYFSAWAPYWRMRQPAYRVYP
jgi:hypothetical protein